MRLYGFIITLLIVALYSNSGKAENNVELYLLIKSEALKVPSFHRGEKITDYESVSDEEISRFHVKLYEYLAGVLENENTFRVQIFGYKKDDKKYIYFNAFCEDDFIKHAFYWKKEIVYVLGGGRCYFEGYFEVGSSEIVKFRFGGVS